MKKVVKFIMLIVALMVMAVCFTACNASIDRGIVLTKGEQMDVNTVESEDGSFGMKPFFKGYYIRVAKCDDKGNIETDGSGKPVTCWFRTSNGDAYKAVVVGGIWEKTSAWSVYSMA